MKVYLEYRILRNRIGLSSDPYITAPLIAGSAAFFCEDRLGSAPVGLGSARLKLH